MKNANLIAIGAVLLTAVLFFKWYTHVGKSNKSADSLSELIIGTNASYPPFEYIQDGKLIGFEIDLMNEIAKKLGKKITFKDLAFDALLLELTFGRIHMIAAAMTPTPERAQQVLFTQPYLEHDPLIVITLAKHPVSGLSDLAAKEVIVNDGYTAESYMAQQKKVQLKRLPTPAEAFLALTSGRAFAFVSARSTVQPFFDRHGTAQFAVHELDASDSYALAIARRYPALQSSIQSALTSLETDGTLAQLKEKWHLTGKS